MPGTGLPGAFHISKRVTKVTPEQLGNGPGNGGNPPPGGAHAVFQLTETITVPDKPDPFLFYFDFFILPDGWPDDAWLWELIDPPSTFDVRVFANTAVYGNAYLLDDKNDFLGFQYSFFAPAVPETIHGFPYEASFIGIDPGESSFNQISLENGFHPVVPKFIPEPSTIFLFALAFPLLVKRKSENRFGKGVSK